MDPRGQSLRGVIEYTSARTNGYVCIATIRCGCDAMFRASAERGDTGCGYSNCNSASDCVDSRSIDDDIVLSVVLI